MKEKFNGVLLHISSLPGKYGIGSLGHSAFSFVDFLARSGVDYWQVLPIGQTSFGDSPYQSPSAFAGNPYFIDIDTLVEKGLLTVDEASSAIDDKIDYEKLFNTRYPLLRLAYGRFAENQQYLDFVSNNGWLDDYALFMALKGRFFNASFDVWPKEYRNKNNLTKEVIDSLKDECDFWKFVQYEFYCELGALSDYAHEKGVKLIGDIPIYVAYDCADVWAHPELFKLTKSMRPTSVAGVPPDYFSATGQLWGNPLYNWKVHKESGFEWWHNRLQNLLTYFDKIRIDHFRAFESYYAVPFGAENAMNGKWIKGVGTALFEGIDVKDRIIAEDLGIITDKVRRLVKKTGFPGMKVFQFAFDGKPENEHLPQNIKYNTVYYTGTHDNDTLRGWYENADSFCKMQVANMTGSMKYQNTKILKRVMKTKAFLVVVPMQDYLNEGSEARINTPGVGVGNWSYRLKDNYFEAEKTIKAINNGRNKTFREKKCKL